MPKTISCASAHYKLPEPRRTCATHTHTRSQTVISSWIKRFSSAGRHRCCLLPSSHATATAALSHSISMTMLWICEWLCACVYVFKAEAIVRLDHSPCAHMPKIYMHIFYYWRRIMATHTHKQAHLCMDFHRRSVVASIRATLRMPVAIIRHAQTPLRSFASC